MLSTDVPKSKFQCRVGGRGTYKRQGHIDPDITTADACTAAGGKGSFTYTPEEEALFNKLFAAEEEPRRKEQSAKQTRNMIIALSVLGGLILLTGIGLAVAFIIKRRR